MTENERFLYIQQQIKSIGVILASLQEDSQGRQSSTLTDENIIRINMLLGSVWESL